MRFTILSQYYPPEVGAPQVRLAAFARCLRARGHDVQVVTAMPNYPTGKTFPAYRGKVWMRETLDGTPVTRTWIKPATGRGLGRMASYLTFALSCLPALASVRKADVLFVETPPLFLCLSAWLISVLRPQKLCVNISDLWPDSVVALGVIEDGLFLRLALGIERFVYSHAWRVCGVTQGILETVADKKGVDPSKLLFLPNGVDTAHLRAVEADPMLAGQLGMAGKKVFAYTGTLGYAQGLDVILSAADVLRDREDVRFVLLGNGPEEGRLRDLADKMRLPNVVFLQAMPFASMPSFLALTIACIVPLRDKPIFEGARPSKMFPAWACAKPLIFSGRGEAAGLVLLSGAGVVCPPEEPEALARAVSRLADNAEEATAMGRRGREFVERELDWQAIVDRWLSEVGDG